MGVCISRGPGGCAQWVRIEVNGRTTTKGWLAVLGQTPSFCMLSAELHPPKKSSVRYSCCDIVKLPYMPTSFGDHHFPAWLCFQNSSLQHVHLPVCVLPTWADSVPSFGFLTFLSDSPPAWSCWDWVNMPSAQGSRLGKRGGIV